MILEIRQAHAEDAAQILEVTHDAFSQYAASLGQPDKVAALRDTVESIQAEMLRKTVLVGCLNGRVIGTARIEAVPGNIAYMTRFGVRSDAQNSGMGHMLIHEVARLAREQQLTAVALHTCTKIFPLVRFYYGQGFYIHSTSQDRGYVRGLFLKELGNVSHETMDLSFVSKL